MTKNTKTYKTDRLILRPLCIDDVQAVYSYMGNHENTKYMRAGQQTIDGCADFINSIADNEYVFAVAFDGRVIGTTRLVVCEGGEGFLGWIIHRDYWGRGFCTEIGKCLLTIAFEELNLRRVYAHCDTKNIGSWRTMEKIGMRREGCFVGGRCAYKYAPDYHGSEYSYAILREEYFAGRTDYRQEMLKLLSAEYNCAPEDFTKGENTLTKPALNSGRRRYSDEPNFFHMVTAGGGTVVTADECLHEFLRGFLKDRVGHKLFEIPNLLTLEKELNSFGYTLTTTYHMFLPYQNVLPQRSYPVKWFYGREEIEQFYGDKRFPNAICDKYLQNRPDTIVVCAYDGDNIMGMAGCSLDAPRWQQIGIDVMPEYRSKGVGTYLVTLLKNKLIQQGDIPFYGTSLSNYHSWNIALNCGFRPAWVEIGASKINR